VKDLETILEAWQPAEAPILAQAEREYAVTRLPLQGRATDIVLLAAANEDGIKVAPVDAQAHREQEVSMAVEYLQHQLHKSVSSLLGSEELTVKWTREHERAYQDMVQYV